ncbi:MAG: hypothetical protein CMJ78_02030 [Planctomycetaceae bacterium]|nr:hypothetical protein [Planctomycetaceae bacterium]
MVFFAILCFGSGVNELMAQDKSPCHVRVIVFVPADVTPPTNYQTRIDQIVDYTETFFKREFKRWEHEDVVMPFRRTADGHVEVTIIRGKKNTAEYKPVAVRAEVTDANRRKGNLKGGRQVWWIMMYRGNRPVKNSFLGGFGREIGGWAVCNLDLSPGRVSSSNELGSTFLKKLTLKGMIHELGHGFQLPHIGPLRGDDAGNTLMGPTHFNYRRVVPIKEERVYLCEAEAALLANHPAFRGVADTPHMLPKLNVQNLKYAVNSKNKNFLVSGKLVSRRRGVYAVVADEADARPGEYWTKTYVSKLAKDGNFEVAVTELAKSNGTLKLWFAFEGGTQTGNGRSRSRGSGIPKAYVFQRNQWMFR